MRGQDNCVWLNYFVTVAVEQHGANLTARAQGPEITPVEDHFDPAGIAGANSRGIMSFEALRFRGVEDTAVHFFAIGNDR